MAVNELISEWRSAGPITWAEGPFGWIDVDGQPITLLPWQRDALAAWWEHRQTTRTLAFSNIKKVGKTALNAILTAWRWLALPGEHFAAGNDLDQSTGRQFAMIADMVKRNPYLKRNVKVTGKVLTFTPTGSTLTALANDAAGNAGANHLTASHTEAWGVEYEGSIRAWEELTPPPGLTYGFPALRVVDSYAGFEGQSQTWGDLVDRGRAGVLISDMWPIFKADGLLLFHIEGEEAQERCFRGTPEEREAYYQDESKSFASRPGSYQRLHFNRRAAAEGVFITAEAWDDLIDPGYRCPLPARFISLHVAIDLGVKRDWAAVVSVIREMGGLSLGPYRLWKPPGGGEVDLSSVEEYLFELGRSYKLVSLAGDPSQFLYMKQRLNRGGLRTEEFSQQPAQMAKAGSALFDSINQHQLRVYPGANDLRACVLNAHAIETGQGVRLVKQKQSKKIDAAIALAMAVALALETPITITGPLLHGAAPGWSPDKKPIKERGVLISSTRRF